MFEQWNNHFLHIKWQNQGLAKRGVHVIYQFFILFSADLLLVCHRTRHSFFPSRVFWRCVWHIPVSKNTQLTLFTKTQNIMDNYCYTQFSGWFTMYYSPKHKTPWTVTVMLNFLVSSVRLALLICWFFLALWNNEFIPLKKTK